MILLLQKPVYQAVLFLLFTPLLIFVLRPESADKAWQIAVYVFGVFLVVNAALLWFAEKPWGYFFYSIASALLYILLIALIMRVVLRLLRVESSEESAMAFLIVIYQPFALMLMMLLRWIVKSWF